MRISKSMQHYLHYAVKSGDEIYLFGSRTDDNKRGGDIDIAILSQEKYTPDELSQIKMTFMENFGWQKLDLVNWTFSEQNAFKDFVMDEAIKL